MKLINEDKNKAIITTRQIMDRSNIITHVFYDEDGDWQFFDDINIKTEDAMVISVAQILNHDDTLNNLPDMETESCAYRDNKTDGWKLK